MRTDDRKLRIADVTTKPPWDPKPTMELPADGWYAGLLGRSKLQATGEKDDQLGFSVELEGVCPIDCKVEENHSGLHLLAIREDFAMPMRDILSMLADTSDCGSTECRIAILNGKIVRVDIDVI